MAHRVPAAGPLGLPASPSLAEDHSSSGVVGLACSHLVETESCFPVMRGEDRKPRAERPAEARGERSSGQPLKGPVPPPRLAWPCLGCAIRGQQGAFSSREEQDPGSDLGWCPVEAPWA